MRLLFVLDQWPELSETFVANELRALRRLGHDVRVLTGSAARRPNPQAPSDVDVELLSGAGRMRQWRDLAWLAARRPLSCALDLARRPRWRRQEWVRPLRALAVAARGIDTARDEHLHAHFAAGAALDALRLSALTGRTLSVTAHAYDIFLLPRNLRDKLAGADAVFTGCHYNVRHLRRIVPEATVHKVVMGVDPSQFERRRPLAQGRTVVAVGRLVEKKGFDVLVDAVARLPGAQLRIVGAGPQLAPLRERVAALGVEERIELLGSRPPDEVRVELERADVLAMPCVVAADGDRDSMPVVVKEAMAMGLLVVASDEVGLPECVLAPWGFLAPPGDRDALCERLGDALALDADQRRRAGEQARAWVRRHAHVDVETRRMAGVIEAICQPSPTRPVSG